MHKCNFATAWDVDNERRSSIYRSSRFFNTQPLDIEHTSRGCINDCGGSMSQKSVSELVESMGLYRKDGVITQADGDKGDTLNRIGAYYSALYALGVMRDDTQQVKNVGLIATLNTLTNSPTMLPFGRFRRGNSVARWFNNSDNVTRDQMVPIEAALALSSDTELARAHFWARAKRLFFHFSTQNDGQDAGPLVIKLPDICTPSEFGTLVRATRYKWLYWILPITDLFLWLDVGYSRSLNERSLYDSDNQLVPQVLAALDQPTFVTEFVRRTYAQTDAATRIRDYYSEASGRNGIAPLGELLAISFEKAIGGI